MKSNWKINWDEVKKAAASIKVVSDPELATYAENDFFKRKTDEANEIIARVGLPQAYYDQQANKAWFFNKRTMTFSDIIYGITMVEQGVSRVVPVDLRALV